MPQDLLTREIKERKSGFTFNGVTITWVGYYKGDE
eukprot:CAMPEP_0194437802 /NCGR_PEP_ID=MMETSP0176-20130528/101708_1 /TAXON_ID=216777 /ORGANISM="Proboscia alata, Strain PI-D3" /LENGTH=34 /DNA_ID= /DNA_START= /DNA_END= /DNA_ORIENTATION=